MDTTSNFETKCQNTISSLKEDLKSIRTGRANPALIENIIVETYGGQSKLKLYELATISTEGPTNLVVVPFDPATVADIEKAILKSPLNLSPHLQTNRLIIRLPTLSSEQRQKMVKLLNQKIEEKKVIIRNQRNEVRKKIKTALDQNQLTKDDKFRLEKEIDSLTQKYMEEIKILKDTKEKEIIEI